MATSKAKKQKKKAQAQRRQAHNKQKGRTRDEHREHLPKTGTAEDDAYLLRRSREDLLDFGLADRKRGWVNAVLIVGVLVALALGVLWLIYITR
ncbi:MAG: hypothetical protein HYX32_06515 [Actinobacteria bacterium]|nr:hypothetical protein [Actinomycetota bacterium]